MAVFAWMDVLLKKTDYNSIEKPYSRDSLLLSPVFIWEMFSIWLNVAIENRTKEKITAASKSHTIEILYGHIKSKQ